MFCETLNNEEEVYQAYLLYASLHGLSTEEEELRGRIASYLFHNQPDERIDAAILAFSEDRIVAPPDIVLQRWGKSRVYELEELPTGGWRHQICECWFEAGCRFTAEQPIRLSHFWTAVNTLFCPIEIGCGSRCSLQLCETGEVNVVHRRESFLGSLPVPLGAEIAATENDNVHYLTLVDAFTEDGYRLLMTRALAEVPLADVIEYAANAFTAPRNKC